MRTRSRQANPALADRLQLVVFLQAAGDRPATLAEVRDLTDNHVTGKGWRVSSEFNANMQRWGAAISELEIALQHSARSFARRARHAAARATR
jgi:hypothetical protein